MRGVSQSRPKVRLASFVLLSLLAAPLRTPAQENGGNSNAGTRPLTLHRNTYKLRAGESVVIAAPQESIYFLRTASSTTLRVGGVERAGLRIAESTRGDEVRLAASLTVKAGDYSVVLAAVGASGELRTAAIKLTVEALPFVAAASSTPPVVLLNGWQQPGVIPPTSCPIAAGGSADTFGSLEVQLRSQAPMVYFFDNCNEQSANGTTIEGLGVTLGQFINMIRYSDGSAVPQVDIVSHSMGGLITRSYLAGLQPNGVISPPLDTKVRKFIEIATPNFGSFLAANYSDLIPNGTQASEMVPGSSFLWNLGTWNQHGDDLRGVDALAIIGNAGSWKSSAVDLRPIQNASDGVVSLSSASLGFARGASQTRILPYCHIASANYLRITCVGPGIANVDYAPETKQIVLSFLTGNTAWQAIGSQPTQDMWLSRYGGMYFTFFTSSGQPISDLTGVTWSTAVLSPGRLDGTTFYSEFLQGTGFFEAVSQSRGNLSCGSFSEPVDSYTVVRCKYYPTIYSVAPLLANTPSLVVQSGGPITINGAGFSAAMTVVYANHLGITVTSVTDTQITAYLPPYSGLVQITVVNSSGSDTINIMAAPPVQAPAIGVSLTSVQLSATAGSTASASQQIQITNAGGGTLNWTASGSGGSWLSVTGSGTAPSALTVTASAQSLAARTYNGAVSIASNGASNSPVKIPVQFTVLPAQSAVTISGVSNGASFAPGFAGGGWVTITGSGLSKTTRTWQSSDFVNGLLPVSLDGVSVKIGNSSAYVYYISPTQLNILAPFSSATVDQTVTVTVTSPTGTATMQSTQHYAAPGVFTTDGKHAAALNTDGSLVAPTGAFPGVASHPAKPGDYVSLYVTGLGPTQPASNAGQIPASPIGLANAAGVSIGGLTAKVTFAGLVSPGLYQINFQVPNVTDGDQSLTVQVAGASSQGSSVLTVHR